MDPRYQQRPAQQQQPPPPLQPSQPPSRHTARPPSKSGFSFRSDRSGSDKNSHRRKESLVETSAEKRKRHMSETTKANPNAAISEAQPIALALEKPTLQGLQGIRCNDVYGNPINDPDRSNPTRWRMERPLDTIRSFEICIDKAYAARQSSYYQAGAPGVQSRRASSYMGNNQGNAGYDQANRYSNNGPNGTHPVSRDSFTESGNGFNGYNGQQQGYSPGQGQGQYRGNNGHGQSQQQLPLPQQPGMYPPGISRSKDTLTTGGSNGSDQWNNSTIPTSDESSMERTNGMGRPLPNQQQSGYSVDSYGSYDNGYDNNQAYQRGGYGSGPPRPPPHMSQPQQNEYGGYQESAPPRPLPKDPRPQQPSKNLIRLSQNSIPNGAVQPVQGQRTSWFKKRFSKGK